MNLSKYDYEERAMAHDKDDFWGQVRRTINGVPVGEDQIELICKAIVTGLDLGGDDKLVDIGCGNGALTYRLRKNASGIIGVDRSDYLISVARENFQESHIEYVLGDAMASLSSLENFESYNKVLFYGVFSFFEDGLAEKILKCLSESSNIERIFIGNVRDRSLAEKFYKTSVGEAELDDHQSSMGKWRPRDYFSDLAKVLKMRVEFSKMPDDFYAHEYYYDVVYSKYETSA